MPTAVASLPPVSQPPTAATSPLAASSAANPAPQTPFDRVLATAARAAVDSVNQGNAGGQSLSAPGTPAGPVTDPTQVVAQASAGVVVVGPGIVLSSSGSPVAVPADNTTGATPTPPANAAETLSRAEQLRLRLALAPQALPQPVGTRVSPLSTTAAQAARQQQIQTDTTAAQNQTTAVPIPGSPANPVGTPLTAQIPIPATGLPAGRIPVVPAQVPIVADLVPATAAPAPPPDLPPQPVAATVAPAPVPDVRIGDHPSTAGERFAATAADAARLKAQVSQPAAGAFAAVLASSTTTDGGPNTAPVAPTAPATGKDLTPVSAGVLVGPAVAPQSAVVPAAAPVPEGQTLVNAATTAGRPIPSATAGPVDRTSTDGVGFATVFRVQTTGVDLATPPAGDKTAPTANPPAATTAPAHAPTTVITATTSANVTGVQAPGTALAATPGPTAPATVAPPTPAAPMVSERPAGAGLAASPPADPIPPALPSGQPATAAATVPAPPTAATSPAGATVGGLADGTTSAGRAGLPVVGGRPAGVDLAAPPAVAQPTATVSATPSPSATSANPPLSPAAPAGQAGNGAVPATAFHGGPAGTFPTATPAAGQTTPTAGTAANPPAALTAPAPTAPPAAPAVQMAFDGAGGFAAVLRERMTGTAKTPGADQASGAAGNPLVAPATLPPSQAPPAPAAVAAPTPAVQVADGVIAHARALATDGTTEFRLRLDPPELGRVNVRLISDGDSIRGQVVVANDSVRQMIESQLPELRQRLEQAGLTVGRFDVSTDPGAGGNGNPYRGNSPADFVPPAGAATAAAQPHPRTPTVRRPAGGLDVTV